MRRKMLITVALVVVMLFNCIAPVIQVQAATAKTTMTFNTALYKGLKSYFKEQGISAVYNDGLHTIKMENSTIAEIKELSLKEKGISDIAGLDAFTNVERLILSGNDLDEESNLSILNNFANLSYLDISSNQISDISEIKELVDRLIAIDSNAINLTSQIAKIVVDVPLSSSEQEIKVTYSLPQILQMAGIAENGSVRNQGVLKADWLSGKYYVAQNGSTGTPYIVNSSIPNPVTETNNNFDIIVGSDAGGAYTQYQGLIKWVINIKDISNVSYNVNPAAENILKDSMFTLYYVIHSDSYEGVIFEDNNFYRAVKEQLTANQTINNDLLSYKYITDENCDVYYHLCYITDKTDFGVVYCTNGEESFMIQNFNIHGYDGNAIVNILNDGMYKYYEIQDYEVEYYDDFDNNGNITRVAKIKIPCYNNDCRNLYQDYYDEPCALVISDTDIVNKITSLILNDKRIMDLSGLEKFVGLESNLNASYNYVDTLANIYELQLNKEENNNIIQDLFNNKRSAMSTTKDKVTEAYNNIAKTIAAIEEELRVIREAKEVIDSEDSSSENYKSAISSIESSVQKIGNSPADEGSLLEELEKYLNDSSVGINPFISELNYRLNTMYEIFNKEYKLTTLLIPELNYQTEEEYETYLEKIGTKADSKALVKSQVSRIETFESEEALSSLEKSLIVTGFGLVLSEEEEYPISAALNQLVENYEERDAERTTWTSLINTFIEINLYSQAANYCLLERMNNDYVSSQCAAEKYFKKLIEDYEYEGIDTSLAEDIYQKTGYIYNGQLYNIFNNYMGINRIFGSVAQYSCLGNYNEIEELSYNIEPDVISYQIAKEVEGNETTYEDKTINYIGNINLTEENAYGENVLDVYFFEQFLALANKFTAVDEISRYITLSNLKRIDVRNNQIETFGNIIIDSEGTTANLATLKNLKEFYAGHNIITGDIDSVNWADLTTLKKLDLSYNFITDISPLQVLKNLRYLNVSDNLLEGAFNLRLKEIPKLQELILSGNKYTDITQILLDYEMDAQGDFTNYFAREDTLDIDLSRQELEIDISDAIAYAEDNSVYEVELPPIFAQLEFIDANRTSYGSTSSKGTITAKGGIAHVPVSKIGSYEGTLKVIAANGYPEDVTTSFGIDTVCTIRYVVKNIRVDSVKISGESTRMEVGTSRAFTATVDGESVPDTTVEWNIVTKNIVQNEDGSESIVDIEYAEGTTITQEGLLTIDPNETATSITIEATSNYDDGVKDTITLEIYRRTVTGITVESITDSNAIVTGKSDVFIATVNGTDLEDENKHVTWSIEGKTSADTKIEIIDDIQPIIVKDEEGKPILDQEGNAKKFVPNGMARLTVGADETADTITIKAISTFDETRFGTKDITINKKKVTGVNITGSEAIRTGNTNEYTAEVIGDFLDDEDKTVTWRIVSPFYARYYNENTKLEEIVAVEGEEIENVGGAKFTVAPEEQVEEFVIEATSKFDGNVYDTFTIQVNKKEVTGVNITSGTESIISGKTGEYSAEVTGNYLDDKDKTITWSIIGKDANGNEVTLNENTKIDKIVAIEGEEVENIGGAILTVGTYELADKIIVKATSDFEGTIYSEYEVTVNKKEITKVRVYEQGVSAVIDGRGKTLQFTEIVEGNFLDAEDKEITWSISGNQSSITRITENGMLLIGEDESADAITVIATSSFDTTKQGTSIVRIIRKEATSVTISEQDRTVRKGRTYKYNSVVEGNNLEAADRTVTWSVVGQNSSGEEVTLSQYTTITNEGLLTVGAGETAAKLVITATSTLTPTVSGTSIATISDIGADLPATLGYEIDEEDDVVGVSPDTSYTTFKSKFVTDSEFTVKVTREGVEIGEETSVATGDIVTILKEGVALSSNEIVVKGDVNGDGTVSEADSRLVKSHRAKLITLTGLYFKAADIDNNKEITISDVKLILAHRAKIDGYIL